MRKILLALLMLPVLAYGLARFAWYVGVIAMAEMWARIRGRR